MVDILFSIRPVTPHSTAYYKSAFIFLNFIYDEIITNITILVLHFYEILLNVINRRNIKATKVKLLDKI